MATTHAYISAVGHYVPEKVLSNADLEKMVNTSDEWIRSRTGISERHILDNGATSDLAAGALKAALANRGMDASELDIIIVATVTPDMFFPSTACLVQQKTGAKNAFCFDLSAACSGFVYALVVGAQFIDGGRYKKIAVIGSDKMSSIIDYTERNTCILFGDAGAAVILEPTGEEGVGIIDHRLYSDGSGSKFLNMTGGGSLNPPSHETVDKKMHYIFQDGKAVFKVAVIGMADVSYEIMQRNNLTGNDVDWLVPHQANLRIIDACAERMELDKSKVMINIDRFGNTTAATIPLCISEWWQKGKIKKGQNLVLASFGAGYTWGAVLVKWGIEAPKEIKS
ncbi:MAG: ketoacyl-ACP synthase III [Ignavibacteriales bacterium]|nr:ketoacyl-ACP synthase III [Ignavibacteriales bacterium]